MITLAQIFEPALPSVPPTPWVETWITGSGLPGSAAALVGAILGFVILRRAGRNKLAFGALLGLIALGVAILMIGRSTVTPRELLTDRTADLIQAGGTGDIERLTAMLHPDVRVRARFANAEGRDRVLSLSRDAKRYVVSIGTKTIEVDIRGPQVARTLVTVRIEADALPKLSQWQIDWQKPTPDADWVAVDMEALWIQGFENPVSSP